MKVIEVEMWRCVRIKGLVPDPLQANRWHPPKCACFTTSNSYFSNPSCTKYGCSHARCKFCTRWVDYIKEGR